MVMIIETRKVSVCEMTAVKKESIQAQKKLLLTSFVGELVGPSVGLDDGCSEDRE